jgi:hypothetical protein
MTDPRTLTAEYRSWEWELVLQYEDGSLPAAAWNEGTLTTVATWYAKNLPREQATARYEKYYQRNHHRLLHRLTRATDSESAIESVDAVWQSLLTRAFETVS